MAEIVLGLVGPIIEIGKCVAPAIKRQLTYLCCFDSNIQSLRDEAQNLENERDRLKREVCVAENKAELIVPEVTTWFENVSNKIQVDKTEIDREIPTVKNGCWGIKSRYRLSRKAAKITKEMKQLVEDRNKFNCISTPPPPAAHVSIPLGDAYQFQSRKRIEEEIMEALRANEIGTVGICGMGGVGKTTMAKRIMNRMRDENIFQEIPMAVVSHQVDMLKIQDAIAEPLGLNLEGNSLLARAARLRARLTGSATKRILVVLDDVWETLRLDDLGIPCGSEWCKILLTSRNWDTLNKMDVQKICGMKILSNDEAWLLFKEKAGTCVDDENLRSLAGSVVEECKGLPLALVAVAGALKNITDKVHWEGALQQLKSFNPIDVSGVIKEVYNPLKLSYTYLESRHAKSLFLLCSLFPEDDDISLEDLALYCMGLRLFCNLDFSDTSEGTLEKVRKTVFMIVGMLKNCFLLHEGWNARYVKMHDVVRDVAIYIASNESNEGTVDVKFNPMRASREYTYESVSLISKKSSSLLRLHGLGNERFEIKESSLFEEIQELNVLSFKNISLKSLPMKTQLLKNLRTLRLESCKLGSLSVVGKLLSLEILCCLRCSGIKELPVEIGKLNQLKLLDFSYCRSLTTIPPGVISNLDELEEFKMIGSFDGWEPAAAVQEQDRRNASLNEFENLSKLTCLEIQIRDFNLAAEEICFPPNIVGYHIRIGHFSSYMVAPGGSSHEKRGMLMKLGREIKLGSWVLRFLRSANFIYLDLPEAHNMKSLTSTDDESKYDVFPFGNLEFLHLYNLPNLEEILDGEVLDSFNSFKNLRKLLLYNMPALKHLCKRPARNVVSLEKLERIWIEKCSNLVNLFSFTMDGQNENAVNHVDDLLCIQNAHFPMLKELTLSGLDRLEVIWDAPIIEGSSSFSNLRELDLSNLPAMTHLWKTPSQNILLRNLTKIFVKECQKLRSLFSSTMSMEFILQLEQLEIKSCMMMEQVVLLNEGNESSTNQCRTIQFPKLGSLKIEDCSKPMHILSTPKNNQDSVEGHDNDTFHLFCSEQVSFGSLKKVSIGMNGKNNMWCRQIPFDFFSQLEELEITGCNGVRSLFSTSVVENLINLKELSIEDCNAMVKVIEHNEEMLFGKSLVLFPSLKELKLRRLPKLESFCNRRCNLQLPSLEKVDICERPSLEFFRMEYASFSSLKNIRISGVNDESNIWCPQIPLGFFNQLEELEITYFNHIKGLFSTSVVENLVNLRKLEISVCNEMVKVIEVNEEMLCAKSHMLFPNLKQLNLWCLSKLESFCNWGCNLQLPSLEEVYIDYCPFLEVFSMGSVSTPNLKSIRFGGEYEILGDLNSEIQSRFKAKHQPSSTDQKESTSTEKATAEANQGESEIQEEDNN